MQSIQQSDLPHGIYIKSSKEDPIRDDCFVGNASSIRDMQAQSPSSVMVTSPSSYHHQQQFSNEGSYGMSFPCHHPSAAVVHTTFPQQHPSPSAYGGLQSFPSGRGGGNVAGGNSPFVGFQNVFASSPMMTNNASFQASYASSPSVPYFVPPSQPMQSNQQGIAMQQHQQAQQVAAAMQMAATMMLATCNNQHFPHQSTTSAPFIPTFSMNENASTIQTFMPRPSVGPMIERTADDAQGVVFDDPSTTTQDNTMNEQEEGND